MHPTRVVAVLAISVASATALPTCNEGGQCSHNNANNKALLANGSGQQQNGGQLQGLPLQQTSSTQQGQKKGQQGLGDIKLVDNEAPLSDEEPLRRDRNGDGMKQPKSGKIRRSSLPGVPLPLGRLMVDGNNQDRSDMNGQQGKGGALNRAAIVQQILDFVNLGNSQQQGSTTSTGKQGSNVQQGMLWENYGQGQQQQGGSQTQQGGRSKLSSGRTSSDLNGQEQPKLGGRSLTSSGSSSGSSSQSQGSLDNPLLFKSRPAAGSSSGPSSQSQGSFDKNQGSFDKSQGSVDNPLLFKTKPAAGSSYGSSSGPSSGPSSGSSSQSQGSLDNPLLYKNKPNAGNFQDQDGNQGLLYEEQPKKGNGGSMMKPRDGVSSSGQQQQGDNSDRKGTLQHWELTEQPDQGLKGPRPRSHLGSPIDIRSMNGDRQGMQAASGPNTPDHTMGDIRFEYDGEGEKGEGFKALKGFKLVLGDGQQKPNLYSDSGLPYYPLTSEGSGSGSGSGSSRGHLHTRDEGQKINPYTGLPYYPYGLNFQDQPFGQSGNTNIPTIIITQHDQDFDLLHHILNLNENPKGQQGEQQGGAPLGGRDITKGEESPDAKKNMVLLNNPLLRDQTQGQQSQGQQQQQHGDLHSQILASGAGAAGAGPNDGCFELAQLKDGDEHMQVLLCQKMLLFVSGIIINQEKKATKETAAAAASSLEEEEEVVEEETRGGASEINVLLFRNRPAAIPTISRAL
ncbi:hypothetical protein QBC38DRAFT_446991 [Podospora fimiseda]|uniref:Uncharacterized protein n=1 Tax=Podospora fimiseda TaxID=252190 RepID=A0AAN7GPD8_9PEZI|nr:hypothetical protein QBC38DRAFT_446991 [Podospora fimiseda]